MKNKSALGGAALVALGVTMGAVDVANAFRGVADYQRTYPSLSAEDARDLKQHDFFYEVLPGAAIDLSLISVGAGMLGRREP